jgi:hypothetical protein
MCFIKYEKHNIKRITLNLKFYNKIILRKFLIEKSFNACI